MPNELVISTSEDSDSANELKPSLPAGSPSLLDSSLQQLEDTQQALPCNESDHIATIKSSTAKIPSISTQLPPSLSNDTAASDMQHQERETTYAELEATRAELAQTKTRLSRAQATIGKLEGLIGSLKSGILHIDPRRGSAFLSGQVAAMENLLFAGTEEFEQKIIEKKILSAMARAKANCTKSTSSVSSSGSNSSRSCSPRNSKREARSVSSSTSKRNEQKSQTKKKKEPKQEQEGVKEQTIAPAFVDEEPAFVSLEELEMDNGKQQEGFVAIPKNPQGEQSGSIGTIKKNPIQILSGLLSRASNATDSDENAINSDSDETPTRDNFVSKVSNLQANTIHIDEVVIVSTNKEEEDANGDDDDDLDQASIETANELQSVSKLRATSRKQHPRVTGPAYWKEFSSKSLPSNTVGQDTMLEAVMVMKKEQQAKSLWGGGIMSMIASSSPATIGQ